MALVTVVAFLGLLLQGALSGKIPRDLSDVGLHTVEIIENHGYPAETHEVTTDDGYIVTLHRIPHGIDDDGAAPRPAAFLMHGLTSSSSDYVNMGPGRSLAYLLADAGYDVWLGNARGNAYSRKHITLDPIDDAQQFFDFTWHEIGYYDVAASIDYILGINGDDSLHYVGHSQGTTTFLVLAATRPEYNAKIKVASLMAPAAILEHRPFTILEELAKYIELVASILTNWKIFEIPYTDALREWAATNCVDPDYLDTCISLFDMIGGMDPTEIETEMIPVIGTNAPSNAGMKQYLHYGQLVKNGGFSMYDFGEEANLQLYGTEKPPAYDWSKISAPVAIYYSKGDDTVPYEDVLTILSKLPNVADDYLVPYDAFNHIDFVFAKDIVELVYNDLMSVMQKY